MEESEVFRGGAICCGKGGRDQKWKRNCRQELEEEGKEGNLDPWGISKHIRSYYLCEGFLCLGMSR